MTIKPPQTPPDPLKITPARDEIASYQRTQAKSSLANKLGEVPSVSSNGGSGLKLILVGVSVVLLLTAVLAGFLQHRLKIAEQSLQLTQARVADLENRLSVTDESMSESSVAMQIKIREMDFEIRKLWDNVWKKNKERFAELETQQETLIKSVNDNKNFINKTEQKFIQNDKITDNLTQQLKTLAELKAQLTANNKKLRQQENIIENANDNVTRLTTRLVKAERLASDNKERLDSVDNFRRNINSDISKLKGTTTAP